MDERAGRWRRGGWSCSVREGRKHSEMRSGRSSCPFRSPRTSTRPGHTAYMYSRYSCACASFLALHHFAHLEPALASACWRAEGVRAVKWKWKLKLKLEVTTCARALGSGHSKHSKRSRSLTRNERNRQTLEMLEMFNYSYEFFTLKTCLSHTTETVCAGGGLYSTVNIIIALLLHEDM